MDDKSKILSTEELHLLDDDEFQCLLNAAYHQPRNAEDTVLSKNCKTILESLQKDAQKAEEFRHLPSKDDLAKISSQTSRRLGKSSSHEGYRSSVFSSNNHSCPVDATVNLPLDSELYITPNEKVHLLEKQLRNSNLIDRVSTLNVSTNRDNLPVSGGDVKIDIESNEVKLTTCNADAYSIPYIDDGTHETHRSEEGDASKSISLPDFPYSITESKHAYPLMQSRVEPKSTVLYHLSAMANTGQLSPPCQFQYDTLPLTCNDQQALNTVSQCQTSPYEVADLCDLNGELPRDEPDERGYDAHNRSRRHRKKKQDYNLPFEDGDASILATNQQGYERYGRHSPPLEQKRVAISNDIGSPPVRIPGDRDRKHKRPNSDRSVKTSYTTDIVYGFRGHQSLDSLLEFIEGPGATVHGNETANKAIAAPANGNLKDKLSAATVNSGKKKGKKNDHTKKEKCLKKPYYSASSSHDVNPGDMIDHGKDYSASTDDNAFEACNEDGEIGNVLDLAVSSGISQNSHSRMSKALSEGAAEEIEDVNDRDVFFESEIAHLHLMRHQSSSPTLNESDDYNIIEQHQLLNRNCLESEEKLILSRNDYLEDLFIETTENVDQEFIPVITKKHKKRGGEIRGRGIGRHCYSDRGKRSVTPPLREDNYVDRRQRRNSADFSDYSELQHGEISSHNLLSCDTNNYFNIANRFANQPHSPRSSENYSANTTSASNYNDVKTAEPDCKKSKTTSDGRPTYAAIAYRGRRPHSPINLSAFISAAIGKNADNVCSAANNSSRGRTGRAISSQTASLNPSRSGSPTPTASAFNLANASSPDLKAFISEDFPKMLPTRLDQATADDDCGAFAVSNVMTKSYASVATDKRINLSSKRTPNFCAATSNVAGSFSENSNALSSVVPFSISQSATQRESATPTLDEEIGEFKNSDQLVEICDSIDKPVSCDNDVVDPQQQTDIIGVTEQLNIDINFCNESNPSVKSVLLSHQPASSAIASPSPVMEAFPKRSSSFGSSLETDMTSAKFNNLSVLARQSENIAVASQPAVEFVDRRSQRSVSFDHTSRVALAGVSFGFDEDVRSENNAESSDLPVLSDAVDASHSGNAATHQSTQKRSHVAETSSAKAALAERNADDKSSSNSVHSVKDIRSQSSLSAAPTITKSSSYSGNRSTLSATLPRMNTLSRSTLIASRSNQDQRKLLQSMADFAGKAWKDFTKDNTQCVYYQSSDSPSLCEK